MKKHLWLLAACTLATGATLSCSSDSDTACAVGETKCEDGKILTCTADETWPSKGVACDMGKECKDGAKACTVISCTNGANKCLDGKLHTCANNAWGNGIACNDGQECIDGATACTAITCTNGASKCLDGKLHTCANNAWGDGVACKDGQECKDDATACTAITCVNGASKCLDGKLHTCANNAWGDGVACDSGFVCINGEDKCSDANAFQCAFTELTPSPEIAEATGKVIVKKGVAIIAGGLYCTDDLTKTVGSWPRTAAAPTQNTDYKGSDSDEWISATITNRPAGLNYCTFIVQLEDESFYACPKSATLGTPTASKSGLKLLEDQTRNMTITCGNNAIDANEECDGTDVGTATCPEGKAGKATCTSQCKLSYAECLDDNIQYNYAENFDGFVYNNRYDIVNSQTKNGKIITLQAAMLLEDNVIEGNTVVISDKTKGYITIESETPDAKIGIGTLTFQYRSWITAFNGSIDSFDKTKHKIEVFINGESTAVGELVLDGEYTSPQTATIIINRDATSITISKQPTSEDNNPRILIDNVKWSNE